MQGKTGKTAFSRRLIQEFILIDQKILKNSYYFEEIQRDEKWFLFAFDEINKKKIIKR